MAFTRIPSVLGIAVFALVLAACDGGPPDSQEAASPTAAPGSLDALAERYVRLSLAAGEVDPDFVDAYHGPEAWRGDARRDGRDAAELRKAFVELRGALDAAEDATEDAAAPGATAEEGDRRWRRDWLRANVDAAIARLETVQGETRAFDAEAAALYDAEAPHIEEDRFRALRARLDAVLPGEGDVADRYRAFREEFVVPTDRVDAVFRAAIEECRARSLARLALPEDERFEVEYVTDRPWSGYNWYQGDAFSLIQVNTDLPIYMDRAVDLACHEGYPGHHVFNLLMEQGLVEERGWMEFSVYPLFSPLSLIAEGTANHGIRMAFPREERTRFEAEVLFPLAGLDPEDAARYRRVEELKQGLDYAGNEAARRYLDGEWDADRAVRWMMDYLLYTEERARQRIAFFDTYRSYVINYNLGRDLVAAYVDAVAGRVDQAERWRIFADLLRFPARPSELAPYLPSPEAHRIAEGSLIVDTHIDVPYRLEDEYEDVGEATSAGDFDHPRAAAGGLDAPFMSIYIPAEYESDGDFEGALELAEELIEMVEAMVEAHPDKFALARSTEDIRANRDAGLMSLPMGLENGAPIAGELERLAYLYERGIRYVTLAHSESNHIADSSYDDARPAGGLTDFGREVVAEMNRLGIMVDVSHISDEAFHDVMEVSTAPVIASHSSARHFTPGFERNMSDDMIRALADAGGVIQINFGSSFLTDEARAWYETFVAERETFLASQGVDRDSPEYEDWSEAYRVGNPYPYADLEDVLDHIDHVVELVGIEHVGLGSDYDGVGDSLPVGLKDAADYPRLIQGLLDRGYDEEAIRMILGGNLMRVWARVEAVAEAGSPEGA